MNYNDKVNETLLFLETQVNLPKEQYINNLLDFAKKQITDFLTENEYCIIKDYQLKLLLNTPPHLIDLAQRYAFNLVSELEVYTYGYSSDPRIFENEDELKLSICYDGRFKGMSYSQGLLRIKKSDLETHLHYLRTEDKFIRNFFEASTPNRPLEIDLCSMGQLYNFETYFFPIIESIMHHHVPSTIVYFEYK